MEYRAADAQNYTDAADGAVTGLNPGSYYVRYKEDENHYPGDIAVVTVSRPTVKAVTLPPSRLERTGATLNGYGSPKSAMTADYVSGVGFEYRKSGDAAWSDATAVMGETFNVAVSGLTADTDYEYRAVVFLKDETAAYGERITFHMLPEASVATGRIEALIVPENPDDTREVIVSIEEGNDVIESKDTGAFNSGSVMSVSFDALSDGNYNIVARTKDGDFTETRMISVTDGSTTQTVFTVPLGKIASIVEVKESAPELPTPKVAVEGLEEMITQEDKDNAAKDNAAVEIEDVEVKLEVENAGQNADGAEALSRIGKIDTFLDLGLFKTTITLDAQGHANSIKTNNIGSVNRVVLEIAIPYPGLVGRAPYMLSYHNGGAKILTPLTAQPKGNFRDGTFFVDYAGGYIFLYASRFSTYAIAFEDAQPAPAPTPAQNPTPSGGGGSGGGGGSNAKDYRIAVADAEHGSVTVSATTAANGQRVTVTLTPESGYLADSVTVKTAADKNVAVTKSATNVFRFTMPANDVTVSATFVKRGADSGDTEPKAAPDGGDSETDSKETPKPLSPEETGVSDWLITDEHPVYIRGFSDGTFRPTHNVTRAQTAMMFYRLLKNQNVARTESFNDMNGDEWYAEAVYALSSLGIIQGYSDGSFRGNNSITRAAFTAIATRFAKSNATVSYDSYGDAFTDVPETHWARDTIAQASSYGWVGGYADGSFHPADFITRAAVTAIINRMLGRSADEAYVTAHGNELNHFSDVQNPDAWYYYNVAEAANEHGFVVADGKETWSR